MTDARDRAGSPSAEYEIGLLWTVHTHSGLAGEFEDGGGSGAELVRVRGEFVKDGGESCAATVERGDQEAWVQGRRSVVPAAAEGIADRLLEVRSERQLTQRAPRPPVPADLARVEPVDGVLPELPLDLAADLVEVAAERGEQVAESYRGPSPRPEPTTSHTASRARSRLMP